MKFQKFQTKAPGLNFPQVDGQILSKAQSASSTYEQPIFYVNSPGLKLSNVYINPLTAITGAAAGSIAFLNLYRGGVQVVGDGFLGLMSFTGGGGTTTSLTAATANTFPLGQYPWVATLSAAVTAAVSTGGTAVVAGQSLLTTVVTNGTTGYAISLIIEPGTARQEVITTTAAGINNSTGVFTIAAGGTFAYSHQIGSVVVLAASYSAVFTTGAITTNVTTNATLTVQAPSVLKNVVQGTSVLIYDPGLATQEILQPASYTYNNSTGVVTIAATYNSGKFLQSHAANSTVVVQASTLPLLPGDLITFKWTQYATGVALPTTLVVVDYDMV